MAKLNLTDLVNLQNETTAVSSINSNSASIETALENTLSRDGTSPNSMLSDLDMNSNQILNLPTPTDDSDPVTKGYADDAYGNALEHANDAAASATAAATSATNAATSATNAATSATAASDSASLAASTVGDTYVWTTSTSGDPGTGKIGVNNATVSSTTAINISETDNNSNNLAAWIATWDDSTSSNKAVVTIEKTSSPNTVWAMFFVTALTDNGTYDTLTASYITGAGSFTNGDTVTVGASLIGNKGTDGSMSGPASSVDGVVAVFNGTAGTAVKQATGSGLAKLTSGVLSVATASTDYAPATSGTSILKGNGTGGFSSATAGTDYLDKGTTSTLTAGYTVTSSAIGSVTGSNQTITPNIQTRGFQDCTLNGSSLTGTLTFAAPTNGPGVVCVEVVNGGTGAVGATLSTSGYTKVTGDSYATTNGNKYLFWCTASKNYSHLHIQALQ